MTLARRANHSVEMRSWIRARTEMSVLLSGFFNLCYNGSEGTAAWREKAPEDERLNYDLCSDL